MNINRHSHDIIDSDLSKNNVLWRYMDLAKFIDLLESESLYLCRADKFSDKFEGSFTQSVKELIETAYKDNNIQYTYNEFKNKLRERVYINCWHKSIDDSMAMWGLYGKQTNALAITTTVGRLNNEIINSDYINYMYIRKVNYIKHWHDPEVSISPYSNIFSYKVTAYSYEKEVRVILDLFNQKHNISRTVEGFTVPINLNDLLRSIVISPEAPEWFYQLIQKIVLKYELSTKVKRSKLSLNPI
jgi:hypothetical protein